jgi:ribonuclease D
VIKSLLKMMLEVVRMQTFGEAGMQQIQLDTEFLRLQMHPLVPAAEAYTRSMAEQISRSARDRCVAPQHMLSEQDVSTRVAPFL